MPHKKQFSQELAYFIGIFMLSLSAALMAKADFGVSMVIAPAYIIYLKLSEIFPFVTFGMAGYTFQGVLLLVLFMILRKFKFSSLFSFVTAVFYGLALDYWMKAVEIFDQSLSLPAILYFPVGILFGSFGVAMLFHTYIAPEVYELFVIELSSRYSISASRLKTVYDLSSCVLAVILSFAFFGFMHFEGIKWGTVICALVNGRLIGLFSTLLEKRFSFVRVMRINREHTENI